MIQAVDAWETKISVGIALRSLIMTELLKYLVYHVQCSDVLIFSTLLSMVSHCQQAPQVV